MNEAKVPPSMHRLRAARGDNRERSHGRPEYESKATRHEMWSNEGRERMSENAEYNIGYFEGVRAAFLIWTRNLIQYESDGVVELQLNSEKFFTELEAELKSALAARDEE